MEFIRNNYKILQNKWVHLGLREKILLMLCLIVILIFILYQAYYLFFAFDLQQKESELKNKQFMLAKIIPAVKKIEKIKTDQVTYKKIPNTSFIDFIKQDINALNSQKLNNDVYMIHGGIIRVDIKDINFDIIISWLQSLSQTYGVKVKRAFIERLDKIPGDVRFVVELEE